MKAISVRQPWARCIAVGAKTVENRGRTTSHRGLVAIHASKTPDLGGDVDPRVLRLFGPDPRVGAPVGAVVAVADLVDCHRAVISLEPFSYCCAEQWGQPYHHGPQGRRDIAHHLVLANIRALHNPVHCVGKVLLPWELPAAATAEVEWQLADGVRV